MRISLFILIVVSCKTSFAQLDTAKLLVGTWDVCIDLNSLDTNCNKPFTFFQLKENGQFYGGEITCGQAKVPILGTWRFEKGSIYISEYEGACFKWPARGYYGIRFVNDNLFYTVGVSTVGENDGKPIYEIIKRRK